MLSPRTVNEAEFIEKTIKATLIVCVIILAFFSISRCVRSFTDSSEPTSVGSTTTVSPAPSGAAMAQLVDTPSQNISCELHDDFVGCSIRDRAYSEYGLDDCNSELYSVKISSEDGTPQSACGEQFLGNPGDSVHRLEYGSSAYFGDFACTSEVSGLKCWKQSTGIGFILSRENHESF